MMFLACRRPRVRLSRSILHTRITFAPVGRVIDPLIDRSSSSKGEKRRTLMCSFFVFIFFSFAQVIMIAFGCFEILLSSSKVAIVSLVVE